MAAVDNSSYSTVVAEHASDIAKLTGASVMGVYVVDSRLVEGGLSRLLGEELAEILEEDASGTIARLLEREGNRALEMLSALCQQKNIPCEKRVEYGRPAEVLASLAPLYDMAVIGSYGSEARFRTSLLGSTASEMLRLATRPVMVVGDEYRVISHAIVGYDGSPQATRALDTVIDLATAGQWKLTIAVVGNTERAYELAAQAKKFRGLDKVQHEAQVLRRTDPPYALLELLDETGADMIAVGSRGESKLARLLLGSTPEILVREARVPVIVFK